MMAHTPRQLSQQLQALPASKRVVFVHPNYKAQHVILGSLLEGAIYIRLVGQGLAEAELQQQLEEATLRESGQATFDGQTRYAILDECDRAQPRALLGVIRQLLADLPKLRIVVLSRVVPDQLMNDDEICQQASFLPADGESMLWDYCQSSNSILLEVRAFGDGRVQLNGRSVDSWDGALPRALFFYLIDRGMVTRAEIFQVFWPNLSTREATNVFHVTKRKISEVLGTELTVYGSSFYHISPQIQLSYDVSLFNQLVQDSDAGDTNGDMLREALALYRGDYLMSLDADWVVNRRESLQQSACDAMIMLGKICESNGKPEEALGYYLRAAHLKPEREDSTYAAMRLSRFLGTPQDALRAYQRLVKTLRKSLNVAPSAQVTQLAEQIQGSS